MAYKKDTTVYDYMLGTKRQKGAGFFVLFDPDRIPLGNINEHARKFADCGVDAILVGTSLLIENVFADYVKRIRESVDIPVVIFPGEKSQVTGDADAILYLSLLSGRNPEFIIGEQVRSAPLIRALKLEAISTAYILIESGKTTSVEFMSNTRPIPSDKPEIALAHAMAAEIFGMKLIYLEAGSGADKPVSNEMVNKVASGVSVPIVVGGGIRTAGDVKQKVDSGASFIVVGNHFESTNDHKTIEALVKAAHQG